MKRPSLWLLRIRIDKFNERACITPDGIRIHIEFHNGICNDKASKVL